MTPTSSSSAIASATAVARDSANAQSPSPLRVAAVRQGWLFQRLRWQLLRNSGMLFFANSRLRFVTMIAASLTVCAAVYAAAWYGFGLIASREIPFTGGIVRLLFDLMFFALGVMLIFSTGIILYASLFTSAEAKFLLSTPARTDQIFATKFQAAVGFSSWAFLLLGGPLLIAYGVVFHVPWYFYAMLPIYFLGFVVLPGSVGALICLVIVTFFPKRKKLALLLLAGVLLLVGAVWLGQTIVQTRQHMHTRNAVSSLLGQFAFAQSPFMPSHWISNGLLALARGEVPSAWFPLAQIWSNAAMLYVLTAFLAGRWYRRAFDRLSSFGGSMRKIGRHWSDTLMLGLTRWLHPQTRELILKDFRTFRRDPPQWAQLAIFGGLILLYLANSPSFYQQDIPYAFRLGLSLVNLFATALLVCANLGRFVYPMISLEGRKFWILGLLPLNRDRLLWGKFLFAVTISVVVADLMVLLSDGVLGVPWLAVGLHLLTMTTVCLGMAGICVGFSAWMPNFRESDPSKIVVGFGGTLNLVVSLLFLALVIFCMAGPYHLAMAGSELFGQPVAQLPWWTFLGVPLGLAFGALAVWLPMRIGCRSLRCMEF